MEIISILTSAALSAGIPPALLLAVCQTESNFRNVTVAMDGTSASYGICQVKLGTARMFTPRLSYQSLLIPKENARYAAKYLAYQLKRYSGCVHCAVSAYNAGSVRIPHAHFDNTRHKRQNCYVLKVMKNMRGWEWTTRQEHLASE